MNRVEALNLGHGSVAALGVDARATFINRTYAHLLGAILAFAGFEVFLFKSGIAEPIARTLLGGSWLLVLGGFMIVSWLASHVALSSRSMTSQYLALGGFVVAEAIIFVPLLYMAFAYAPGAISSAALVTPSRFQWPDLDRLLDSQRFFVSGRCPALGRVVCLAVDSGERDLWLRARNVLFGRDGCFCGSSDPLRHLQCHAPLSGRSLRRGGAGAVRLGRR